MERGWNKERLRGKDYNWVRFLKLEVYVLVSLMWIGILKGYLFYSNYLVLS